MNGRTGTGLDLTNPAHVKLSLLSHGVGLSPRAIADVGDRFTERTLAYNNSDQPLGDLERIPGEIILGRGIVSALHHRPDSPWRLGTNSAGHPVLSFRGEEIMEVRLPPRPAYYGHRLSNGQTAERYVTQYGVHSLGIFLHRGCHFWTVGEPCKFCSAEPTRKESRDFEDTLSSRILIEAVGEALRLDETVTALEWSGGATSDRNGGFRDALEIIDAVEATCPRPVRSHINILPPDDFSLLALADGIDEITFAMEVWDDALLRDICPGKAGETGRDGFLRLFEAGVKRFGPGRVSCNFVVGLEPLESLLEGCRFMADMGIVPTVAVFHPDPKTPFAHKPSPSEDMLLEFARALGDIYASTGFQPYLLGCRRSSLDSEIYWGYFNDG